MDATLVIGKQGRVVIPAEMRDALGLAAGDRLHVQLTGSRLVLERPSDAASALRGFAKQATDRSLVDELIAERRAAAASE